jgi:hypothetical protein
LGGALGLGGFLPAVPLVPDRPVAGFGGLGGVCPRPSSTGALTYASTGGSPLAIMPSL